MLHKLKGERMKGNLHRFFGSLSQRLTRTAGEKLLLGFSALLSLLVVASFLVTVTTKHVAAISSLLPTPSPKAGTATLQATASPEAVSDVVTKALAFKALLTSTQQATLEQTFTTTLEGRWSNLPNQLCGSCRNGLQFSTLSSTQLAAALEVIKAAQGTVANEGADEFNQIRLADAYLNANGGGSSYGDGIYFIAFLNTPSTTGAWMLQFGGHHYAANIAYNQGHVVGTTPQHEAVEPLSFTTNNTTYSPLTQERDAMAAMLASLDATQLASAKSSSTFNDCVMIPGASTGGPSSFPTTKIGLAGSALNSTQKQLVLAAMKPWVQDADDTVAANLMKIYESELDNTYIAWTGSGTAGTASTFLNASSNYVRIDGPSVWIEFACQGGIVIRNQIHYHTVWRDRNRDYGKDLSLTTPLDISALASTNGASFVAGTLSPEGIGSLFGTGLAASTATAPSTPLPTTLDNVQLQITDSANVTRNAPLFYVSPLQINFQLPANTAFGTATANVLLNGITVGSGTFTVTGVAPGMFSANATGSGIAAAYLTRVSANGTQTDEQLLQYDSNAKQYVATPIDLGASTDKVFLIAFGSGFRNRSLLSGVTTTIGGINAETSFAGAHNSYVGLDQANILIPRSLAGSGNVNVVFSADGKTANTVTINIK